jgi:hypothetical protein
MKRAIIIALCLLAQPAAADEVLTASDMSYLAKFGVGPENLTVGHIDLWQKVHLHYLINDPQIKNRDGEVDYFLDFVSRCAKTLDLAGVTPVSCDYSPPGHP